MLNVWTIPGGVLLVCAGLYYVYLFYRGELVSDAVVLKLTERDIAEFDGIETAGN